MNQFASAVTSNLSKSKKDALTANGAVTRSTSGQSALDLFAIIGSARNAPNDVVRLFSIAYNDDRALALRIALWARDIRGGAGERQAFRNIIKHLAVNDLKVLLNLIPFLSEFGRWDDVIESVEINSPAFIAAADEIRHAIESSNGLAAKWVPRKGAIAVAIRNHWKMTPKVYRKFLVNNTKVVETLMCAKDFSSIEYDKLPSVAGLRYQQAFNRNDSVRYNEYKAKLVKGEVKINVGTLFPHNIVANIRNHVGDALVLNESWKQLPNYLGDSSGKVLVMSDVSGSMGTGIGGNVSCLDVSLALGIYTAERLTGPFKDLVLTFSEYPAFHKLQGKTISEKITNLSRAQWDMSTNLQAAFKLVLDTGLKNKVPQSDMPETIIIVSDMEFNVAGGNRTNYGAIKKQYKDAGYICPKIVFWNVNGRGGNNPVAFDAEGTCMVSGYSPAILGTILSGEEFDPMSMLIDTIMKERYDCVDLILGGV